MKYRNLQKVLVANRSEIAIRIMRAIHELDMRSVAIFSADDRLALHRFKANEAYQVGAGKTPVEAYLDSVDILRIARETACDAIHPGYGFLAENPDFAQACIDAGMAFIGPNPGVLHRFGNKVNAKQLASEVAVPIIPASPPLGEDAREWIKSAEQIGLPVMLKASWGGGGRGMRVIRGRDEVREAVNIAKREARAAFGNDEVFFEKLLENARHVEVQIIGDRFGNVIHLFERDCSLQRRHQKVIERAPAPYLSAGKREALCQAAVTLARHAGLDNAATVEFLFDCNTEDFFFIEVNPRIQVEHTVTEEITGIDIVKAQIRIAAGARIGAGKSNIPSQRRVRRYGHALQCRVTAEDPLNNFIPDHGHLVAYRSPAGPGIRLDGGTAYSGAWINRAYDSLLVKVTARGNSEEEAVSRMRRALAEFRVRGVATNLQFLQQLLNHPRFRSGDYNTRFIDDSPELFNFSQPRTRINHLLRFIADVTINGNKEVKDRPRPFSLHAPTPPPLPDYKPVKGLKQMLQEHGPEHLADWIKRHRAPLITDTTFRDAHQSLLATRLRTRDMLAIAPHYARLMPRLFSIESWGGATFDVAMRFLREDPWERLHKLGDCMPNIMQQMLLRGANGVGYRNYPDNAVQYFIAQSAQAGVDVFRIFDSLNWLENMHVAIAAAAKTGKLVEVAICYSGDILDPQRPAYDLAYYVNLAKQIENTGAHILAIKDMAGLLKPAAARVLIKTLKQEVDMPLHLHTHDTSGVSAATVLAAVEAGVDIFDAAMDGMSGLTSQPSMGSIVEALNHTRKQTEINAEHIRLLSAYWEQVREQYIAFQPHIHSGASEVYVHEMPGGQYTNLREQARAMGIESRWRDIARAYTEVNMMFGDIVKVTPTSKVVGDMALAMVTAGLSREEVMDPDKHIAFPESVIGFFRGDLGQPAGGFPRALQKKILNDELAITVRPGSILPPVDIDAIKTRLDNETEREVKPTDIASYLMYPEVFMKFTEHQAAYGDVSILPTHVFLYGMESGTEITLPVIDGRQVIIRYLASSQTDEDGMCRAFFEVNGQPQTVIVRNTGSAAPIHTIEKAETNNPGHVGAPIPGLVVTVEVTQGQKVKRGDTLVILEAMKMQTAVPAEASGTVKRLICRQDHVVDTGDLLLELEVEE